MLRLVGDTCTSVHRSSTADGGCDDSMCLNVFDQRPILLLSAVFFYSFFSLHKSGFNHPHGPLPLSLPLNLSPSLPLFLLLLRPHVSSSFPASTHSFYGLHSFLPFSSHPVLHFSTAGFSWSFLSATLLFFSPFGTLSPTILTSSPLSFIHFHHS